MNRETEPKPREKPFVRFIFLRHHEFPEDPTHLLSLLSDANVIFLEALGTNGTPQDRREKEQFAQHCLADPTTLDDKEQKTQDAMIVSLLKHPTFPNELVRHLAKSGKQIFFIDIDSEHPAHVYLDLTTKETQELRLLIKQGHISEARALTRQICAENAQWCAIREEVVAEQISTIITSLQNRGEPIRAAVIQGLIHTPTADLLSKNDVDIETHVTDIPLPLVCEIWQKLRLGKPVEDYEYDQALLIHYILLETVTIPEQDSQLPYLTDLVRSLKPEDAPKLIAEFEMFYRQAKQKLVRTRGRLTEEELKPYIASFFSEAAHKTLEVAKYWAGK